MTPTVSLRVQMHPGRSSFPSQIGSRGWRLLGAIRLLLQEEVGRAGQGRQWVGSLLPIYSGYRKRGLYPKLESDLVSFLTDTQSSFRCATHLDGRNWAQIPPAGHSSGSRDY